MGEIEKKEMKRLHKRDGEHNGCGKPSKPYSKMPCGKMLYLINYACIYLEYFECLANL